MKTINGNDVTFDELVEIVTKAFGDNFIAKAFAYTAEARGATNIRIVNGNGNGGSLIIAFDSSEGEVYRVIKTRTHFIAEVWCGDECIHVKPLPVYNSNPA